MQSICLPRAPPPALLKHKYHHHRTRNGTLVFPRIPLHPKSPPPSPSHGRHQPLSPSPQRRQPRVLARLPHSLRVTEPRPAGGSRDALVPPAPTQVCDPLREELGPSLHTGYLLRAEGEFCRSRAEILQHTYHIHVYQVHIHALIHTCIRFMRACVWSRLRRASVRSTPGRIKGIRVLSG